MKKLTILKITSLFFLFLASFFIFGDNAKAEAIDLDYSTNYATSTGWYQTVNPYFLQRFVPNQTNLASFEFFNMLQPDYEFCVSVPVYLCKGYYQNGNTAIGCVSDEFVASTTLLFTLGSNKVDFGNVPLIQGENYYFVLSDNQCAVQTYMNLSETNSDFYTYNPSNTSSNNYSLNFKTYYNDSYFDISFTPYASYIGLNNDGIYKDFETWNLDLISSATSSQNLIFGVFYYPYGTGSTSTTTDWLSLTNFLGFNSRVDIPKTTVLQNGRYTATAYILDTVNLYYLDNETINFWINNETGSSTSIFATTTTACSGFWCDMFSPSKKIKNQFLSLKDLILSKPPLGYFSKFSEFLNAFSFSETTDYYSNTFFKTLLDTFKICFTLLIAFKFSFYFFNRIKKLNL